MTESGAQLFARLEARRCLKDIEKKLFPGDGGPENGEVVELYGSEGTGKTELLYHLLSRCLLPLSAGGLEVDVVFMDTDYSLDMLRLVSILDSRLNAGTHQRRRSIQVSGGHSISAFYWPDRCEGGTSVTKQEEKLSKCAELLGRLLRDYRITVFATCHAIRRNYSGPSLFLPSSLLLFLLDIDRPYLAAPAASRHPPAALLQAGNYKHGRQQQQGTKNTSDVHGSLHLLLSSSSLLLNQVVQEQLLLHNGHRGGVYLNGS
ncbi:DNA repair protein XRCC2 [Dissostichus eleginoides]|uniref:DNA repair protein XRCC2 n=1 Tax=Dissostichus eleginoides TaxID=100907 RepID=A0AAD9B2G7_DISEL|nr:DNA repair protein XRCC2 [Dissostichus eleginoides]